MILADTSVWIDHFRITNLQVGKAIADRRLLMHPFVIGELALGSLQQRQRTISQLLDFRTLPVAATENILDLIERATLFGRGLGYVDAHLLASCMLAGNCKLLTRDRRLHDAAEQLGIAA